MSQKSKKIQSESSTPSKKIAVCGCGSPLIWTCVFPYAEYWCPECQSRFGMMEVKKIPLTPELKFRHIINTAVTKKYLNATSIFTCSSMMIKSIRVESKNIPESMKARAKKIITEFQSR